MQCERILRTVVLKRQLTHNAVCSYLEKMQVYLLVLDPVLHTPAFVRSTSSFLTIAISLAAAAFCPLSVQLVQPLEQHATFMTTHIYLNNLRSPEIVAALCISA